MACIPIPPLGQHPGAQQLGKPGGGGWVRRDGGDREPGMGEWKWGQGFKGCSGISYTFPGVSLSVWRAVLIHGRAQFH